MEAGENQRKDAKAAGTLRKFVIFASPRLGVFALTLRRVYVVFTGKLKNHPS